MIPELRKPGTTTFAIFTLAMVAAFAGLGIWQLQRRVDKHALIAALKVKQESPQAMITYVRKHNVRGDRRHPHRDMAKRAD